MIVLTPVFYLARRVRRCYRSSKKFNVCKHLDWLNLRGRLQFSGSRTVSECSIKDSSLLLKVRLVRLIKMTERTSSHLRLKALSFKASAQKIMTASTFIKLNKKIAAKIKFIWKQISRTLELLMISNKIQIFLYKITQSNWMDVYEEVLILYSRGK